VSEPIYGVVADERRILVRAVVIAGDRSRADVGFADGRIAQVRNQMAGLLNRAPEWFS